MQDRLTYRVDEAAAMLGISRVQAYDRIRRGELPAIRLGARYLIPSAKLDALLQSPAAPLADDGPARPGSATDGAPGGARTETGTMAEQMKPAEIAARDALVALHHALETLQQVARGELRSDANRNRREQIEAATTVVQHAPAVLAELRQWHGWSEEPGPLPAPTLPRNEAGV